MNWRPAQSLRRGEEGEKFTYRKPREARAEKKVWNSLGDWTQEDPWSPRRPNCSRMIMIGVIQSTINLSASSVILTTTLEAGVVIPIFQGRKQELESLPRVT